MTTDSMFIQHQFLNILNHTNFSNQENVETMYRNVFESIYDSSYAESKNYLLILISILLICSIIGSIANLLVIIIFKFIFNKRFNRNIQSKLASFGLIETVLNKNNDTAVTTKRNVSIRFYEEFNIKKNKLTFNSNLKLFFTLVRYLAVVDLFTCSIAVPATAYEIWNNMKINEICCKLFEFLRAIGVVASNFIIILISIERYLALYNIRRHTYKNAFKFRISIVIIISIFIAVLFMLQVSVYQRAENSIIFIGICLKSENIFKRQYSKIIDLIVTCLFLIGSLFVSIVYFMIFKESFQIRKQYQRKKEAEYRNFIKVFENSMTNSADVNLYLNTQDALLNLEILENENKFFENINRAKCLCFYLNRNMRIAISILLVTCIYYVSIIPWCLTINGLIKYNPYIHYTFLLNTTLNPFIYGFMNPNFRSCGLHLFKLIFRLKF